MSKEEEAITTIQDEQVIIPIAKGSATGLATGAVSTLLLGPIGIPMGLAVGALTTLSDWNKRDQKLLEMKIKRNENELRNDRERLKMEKIRLENELRNERERLEIMRMRLENQVRTNQFIFLGLSAIALAILSGCALIATGIFVPAL